MVLTWQNQTRMQPRSYVCSYCSHRVGPALGWHTIHPGNPPIPVH